MFDLLWLRMGCMDHTTWLHGSQPWQITQGSAALARVCVRWRQRPSTDRLACRSEILASSVDGTVRRFDVRMGCMDVDQLGAPVTAMALSHDGNCVLASCLDGRMRLLDKASGELLAQYSGASPP